MEVSIPVSDEEEAEQIKAAMNDPSIRAFARVSATLAALPSEEDREKVARAACILLDIHYPVHRRR